MKLICCMAGHTGTFRAGQLRKLAEVELDQSFMVTGFKAFLWGTNTKALLKWSVTAIGFCGEADKGSRMWSQFINCTGETKGQIKGPLEAGGTVGICNLENSLQGTWE